MLSGTLIHLTHRDGLVELAALQKLVDDYPRWEFEDTSERIQSANEVLSANASLSHDCLIISKATRCTVIIT